ncbi:MAG TPA: hypothetical protein DCR04_11535 [Flavobacteriales bacterium]|nr:hypothetical protein [Flavobacteriales bacterium]
MNDSQSNNLDMYIVVSGFYALHQTIIDVVPARTAAFATLAANIAIINKEIAGQSSNTTGVTQDKTAARDTLNTTTIELLSPAKAWAVFEKNNTLAAEFDYSLSEIQAIKDDTMQGFCMHRLQLINDNITAMADFGIDPALLVSWQAAIDAYTAILESPREAINSRHLKTLHLKILFKETSALLRNQLDPLMVPFKNVEPQIYYGYKQARMIINRGGSAPNPNPKPDTATLFGRVTNEAEGIPIAGAVISMSSSPISGVTITSDENGEFRREGITPNEYAVLAKADGFVAFEDTILLESNAEFELNISLQPVA